MDCRRFLLASILTREQHVLQRDSSSTGLGGSISVIFKIRCWRDVHDVNTCTRQQHQRKTPSNQMPGQQVMADESRKEAA